MLLYNGMVLPFLLVSSVLAVEEDFKIFSNKEECHTYNEGADILDCAYGQTDLDECIEAEEKAIKLCQKDEDNFLESVSKKINTETGAASIKLTEKNSESFSPIEKQNKDVLRGCVRRGVEIQWALYGNPRRPEYKKCIGKEKEFLISVSYADCSFKWFSQQHRILFYETCLGSFDIGALRSKAKKSIRTLQKISRAIEASTKNNGKSQIVTGSGLITSGVFAGIGVVLTLAGGPGLLLGYVAGATAFGTTIASFFGDNQADLIPESKKQLTQLHEKYLELSKLMILFMESENNFNATLDEYSEKAKDFQSGIETKYENIITAGGVTIAAFGTRENLRIFMDKMKGSFESIMAKGVKQSTSSSSLSIGKEIGPLRKLLNKRTNVKYSGVKTQYQSAKTGNVASVQPRGYPKIMGEAMKQKLASGFSASLQLSAAFMSIGLGVYNVLEGAKKT